MDFLIVHIGGSPILNSFLKAFTLKVQSKNIAQYAYNIV